MALQVMRTYDEQVAGTTVLDALRGHVEAEGSAVLLVPTFSAQLDASRMLAEAGLALGVRVTTPSAWTKERWEVWGDGSRIVSAVERTVAMQRTLKHACEQPGATLDYNPGTVRVLENLARQVLPAVEGLYDEKPHGESAGYGADFLGENGWARMRESLAQNSGLTHSELKVLDLVRTYAGDIHSAGFVEECEAMVRIPKLLAKQGVHTPGVVVSVHGALSRRVRDLLCGLSTTTQVTIVLGEGNPQITASAERSVRELKNAAAACGVQVIDGAVPAEPTVQVGPVSAGMPAQDADASAFTAGGYRARELGKLLSSVFDGESQAMRAKGSVGVLVPAGPKAEAECVARAVNSLVDDGAKSIVVSTPNAERAWRELAPKLAARGIGVKAQFSLPTTDTMPGRAFVEYAQCVARLCSLANTWPAEQPCDEGRMVVLGDDMSWWPPSDLVDFLMSDLSGMPAKKAMRLDRSWRSNRLLTPEAVLKALLNPKDTSARVAQATRELMRGRLASAASKLLSPLAANVGAGANDRNAEPCGGVAALDDAGIPELSVDATAQDALARAQTQGALTAVMEVAKALREVGEYQEAKGVTGEVGNTYPYLEELVALAADGLSCASVVVRPQILHGAAGPVPDGADLCCASARQAAQVEIVPPAVASAHAALSADAVVLCGLTSVESGVPNGDDVASALVEALGVEPPMDAVAQARETFGAQLAIARNRVVLERTLWNAQSKDCYPSVMLTEVLACYGVPGNVDPKDVADVLRGKRLLLGQRSEEDAFANLEATGSVPGVACEVGARPADVLDPELLPYVVVPANGKPELVDGKPMLSPTQIETYLDCPYKWFSLRRLNLGDSDAGFSGAEMGEFVHHVLEVTHRELVSRAAEKAGTTLEEVQANPSVHLPGCRVDVLDDASLERARSVLSAEFEAHRKRQFLRKQRQRSVPLIPHDAQDLGQMDAMKKDLLSVLDYEASMFVGYEPRLFEKRFGYDGSPVEYAGAYINGTIDRVDVDAHGHALVIDYKHKSPNGFTNQYDSLPANMGEPGALEGWVPRHVQTLMYAQYLRKCHPELTVTGAVYLCTKHGHAVAGAVEEGSADNVFGEHAPSRQRMPQVAVPAGESFGQQDKRGMDALLDATEQIVAQKVAELMAGNIEANPRDASSCDYCPVKNCKKRMGK